MIQHRLSRTCVFKLRCIWIHYFIELKTSVQTPKKGKHFQSEVEKMWKEFDEFSCPIFFLVCPCHRLTFVSYVFFSLASNSWHDTLRQAIKVITKTKNKWCVYWIWHKCTPNHLRSVRWYRGEQSARFEPMLSKTDWTYYFLPLVCLLNFFVEFFCFFFFLSVYFGKMFFWVIELSVWFT